MTNVSKFYEMQHYGKLYQKMKRRRNYHNPVIPSPAFFPGEPERERKHYKQIQKIRQIVHRAPEAYIVGEKNIIASLAIPARYASSSTG